MARNFLQLQNAVLRKDFTSSSANLTTAIQEWLNDAYMEVAKKDLRCFIKKETLTIAINTWQYAITLLPNYRKMKKVILNEVGEVDVTSIDNPKYELYEKALADRDTGDPEILWRNVNTFEVDPVPDTARVMTCWYYQVPDLMVADDASHVLPQEEETLLIDYAKAIYDDREREYASTDRKIAGFYAKLNEWTDREFEEEEDQKNMTDLEMEYAEEGRLIG